MVTFRPSAPISEEAIARFAPSAPERAAAMWRQYGAGVDARSKLRKAMYEPGRGPWFPRDPEHRPTWLQRKDRFCDSRR